MRWFVGVAGLELPVEVGADTIVANYSVEEVVGKWKKGMVDGKLRD